ncbi:helix-turn-helix domain-containing protein [Hazenella sp. IB182357]|uniref:Helix-turn-helix domain-containing protein n=1 Tax=Polycladospora coralii TaxID=2771432 RepID=A0A926NDU5_9BACL|nr:helix-turn-helix domain-containing protein [Polycladospora coralii]MBD1373580.1 helix-turn-helix domain-containing protein [Polycladospora coralii]
MVTQERMHVTTEMGKYLKTRRKHLGYTQLEVEEETNIPQSSISSIEKGRGKKVDKLVLESLCRFLDISLETIENFQIKVEAEDQLDPRLQLTAIEHEMRLVDLDQGLDELKEYEPLLFEHEQGKALEPTFYYVAGKYHEDKKNYDEAIEMYGKAIALEEQQSHARLITVDENNSNIQPACYVALARIYNMKHQLDQAIVELDKGIECYIDGGERKYVFFHLWITKAIVLARMDKNQEALKILESLRKKNEFAIHSDARLAIVQVHVELLNKMKLYAEAIELGMTALEDIKINNLSDRAFELWSALGESFSKEKQIKNALLCYNMALKLEEVIPKKYLIIKTYTQLGVLNMELGNLNTARDILEKAIQKGELHKDESRLVEAFIHLAECQIVQKDEEKAYESLSNALRISRNHSFDLEFDILLLLIDICKRNNLQEYHKYSDQFINYAISDRQKRRVVTMQRFEADPPSVQF